MMSRLPPATFTILVMTAEDANRLSRAGAIGVILKPFEPTEFRRVIADILNATVRRSRSDNPS